MTPAYRIRQIINKITNPLTIRRKLNWVYLYGHHRGGTTYMLNQYLKISRRGTGDWMLHESAEAILGMQKRQANRRMNVKSLLTHFRSNLLNNAHIGGGNRVDIVIKQAVGTQEVAQVKMEIEFLSELFGRPPVQKVFIFREPHGWWNSAKLKFNYPDADMADHYVKAFLAYEKNGGDIIEYNEECVRQFFRNNELFQGVSVDQFAIRGSKDILAKDDLIIAYQDFVGRLRSDLPAGSKAYLSNSTGV